MQTFFSIVIISLVTLSNMAGQGLHTPKEKEKTSMQGNFQFPRPSGWVNDFEAILTENEEKQLTAIISEFTNATTNQIAIVTIDSIAPYDNMKDFATDLGNEWGVGQKGKNNGLVIVLSTRLRKVFIATGYATEKILTNDICQKIINEQILPQCRRGDYFNALKQGLNEIINHWK